MDNQNTIVDIDPLVFRLRCAVANVGAIQMAMVEGPEECGSYGDALFCVYELMCGLVDQFDVVLASALTHNAKMLTTGGSDNDR